MPATTNHTGYKPEVSVWTDGRHGPVAGQLLDLMEQSVQPIALGGPFGGNTDTMADRFTAAHYDDLRQMVVERPAAYLLFAADEDPPPRGPRHGHRRRDGRPNPRAGLFKPGGL